MKRTLIGLVLGGLGGIAVGFAVGIFVYPFWFLNDAVSEQLDAGTEQTAIAKGTFIQADPNDPVHKGSGGVTLYRDSNGDTVVFLAEDFEVGPGPRFHVYLADNANILSSEDFKAANTLDLGRLRAFRGSQVYKIPQDTVVTAYQSVVIWCEEFGVLISPAAMTATVTMVAPDGDRMQG